MFFATLGVIASSIENVAIEIRHMQRTEVLEAEEFFSPGQKGSSAMPHTSVTRFHRKPHGPCPPGAHVGRPAMENVALWHERDISHSSVERAIGPDTTVTLDFALNRLAGVIEKLVIYPDNMLKNMNKFRGLVHSQRVLLALTQAGVSREDAYRLVQRNAMKVWEQGADFLRNCWATRKCALLCLRRSSGKNSTLATTPSMSTRSSPRLRQRLRLAPTSRLDVNAAAALIAAASQHRYGRMKVSEADILIVPGYTNSGPDHWQSRWERKLSTARRVEQAEWSKPVKEDWVARLVEEVNASSKPVVLVAHSLGVPTVIHALPEIGKDSIGRASRCAA